MRSDRDDPALKHPRPEAGVNERSARLAADEGRGRVIIDGRHQTVAAKVFIESVHAGPAIAEAELRDVEEVLTGLAPVVMSLARAQRRTMSKVLLQQFVAGLTPTPVDMQRERLRARGFEAVFGGTQWLSAQDIAELGRVHVSSVHRWRTQGRIFSIRHEGRELFPRYALEEDFSKPVAAVADAIKALPDYSGDALAAWFESTSSYLDGQRPRELLATEPARVIRAARETMESLEYAG